MLGYIIAFLRGLLGIPQAVSAIEKLDQRLTDLESELKAELVRVYQVNNKLRDQHGEVLLYIRRNDKNLEKVRKRNLGSCLYINGELRNLRVEIERLGNGVARFNPRRMPRLDSD